MGSPISGGEGLDDGFGDEEAPSSEKPFDDTPFDAGVETSEEDNPEKFIQQLSGKLGQSLRKYTEDLGEPDFDLEKFAINSVLSATNSSKMDQQDQSDIIAKVKSSSTSDSKDDDGTNDGTNDGTDDGTDDGANDVADDTEEGGMDLSGIDMGESHNPNFNGKTVFQNASLGVDDDGMEENKYLNLENIEKKSNIVGKINIKEMVKESLNSVEPQTAPKVDPTVMPERKTRRSKPYRIIPEQIPDPKPKAEKKSGDIEFVKDSGFSEDGNSVTIKFDVYGEPDRFVSNFLNTGEITNLNSGDEDSRYIYQTDILSNGKQYYVLVSKFDGAIDMNTKGYTTEAQFTDGDIPVIEEV